ncbi:MAG TPA: aldose 1-epimerase family protein [Nocardioidaceae bacterium]|jgi:aldose 1-epimerase
MVAPSGEQYEITGHGYRAVVTECGAGLRVLEYDGQPLLDGYGEDQPAGGGAGQLLLPWPNRVRDGKYAFAGRDLQLPLTEPARGHAIHGLTRWTSWTREEQSEASVSLVYRLMAQPGYPWAVDLCAVYDVSADGLTVTVTATNLADGPAPYAQGAHPYFTLGGPAADPGSPSGHPGTAPVDRWELALPAATRLLLDDRKIPVGDEDVADTPYDFRISRPIRDLVLDDAFTGLARDADGRAEVALRDPATGRGVTVWMDRNHRWVQVYTGDDLPSPRARRSLAVEPMTAPPNALADGAGLLVLGPAGSDTDSVSCAWGVGVS